MGEQPHVGLFGPAVAAGTSLRSPTWRGPATDSRVLATIDAIAERLTDERGLVYRFDARGGADGLEGREGTFVLCTFWLAQALALAGQPARARHVFERAIT